ncbi:MAG: hypothetical protein ACK56I_14730, partial [bacterium]
DGVHRHALRVRHRRQGVEGTEDIARPVHQDQVLLPRRGDGDGVLGRRGGGGGAVIRGGHFCASLPLLVRCRQVIGPVSCIGPPVKASALTHADPSG